jgi:hypothetical protein
MFEKETCGSGELVPVEFVATGSSLLLLDQGVLLDVFM